MSANRRFRRRIISVGTACTVDEFAERAKKKAPCILCGRDTYNVGVYSPFEQPAFGAPEGKERHIAYKLCERCHSIDGWMERVEKHIENAMKQRP